MSVLAKLRCTFCDKRDSAAEKLIAGPMLSLFSIPWTRIYICSQCVDRCIEILGSDENWREHQIANLTRLRQRERELLDLAQQLHFQVEKHGSSYSLRRVADVSAPVEENNLTLEETEKFLNTWKLRGFHGG